MLSARWPTPLAHLARQTARPTSSSPSLAFSRSLCSATRTTTSSSTSFLHSYRLALGLSLPLGALAYSTLLQPGSALQCASASDRSYADKPAFSLPDASAPEATAAGKRDAAGAGGKGGPEAESILNLRDLGFGTVSGICVGVFVKKGLRAAAFTLGFVFIGLQYLSSRHFINVNWGAFSSSYDRFITSRAGPPSAQGGNRLARVWTGFIDFVSANVQQRATFVAGVLLGLRLG